MTGVLCKKFFEAYENYAIYFDDYKGVLQALAKMQPTSFLDA
jgi:hypothetical protein